MKLGIFAGTFDPIHVGHVEFAKCAIQEAGLDRVLVVAEKNPYRKKPRTSWDHRQAMIERSVKEIPCVDYDYEFANQLAHQHTMKDMLGVARRHYKDLSEVWFLVGSDTFEHMHKWRDVAVAHEYGGFVVALRSSHTKQWLEEKVAELKKLNKNITLKVVPNLFMHTSSSKVRTEIGVNKTSSDLEPAVENYIHEHQLYR